MMLGSARNSTLSSSRNQIANIPNVICILTLLFTSHLNAQTVATYTFADGTADGWTSFNGASTPVASNAAAYSGSTSAYSLLTTTGSGGAGGPSLSLNGVLQAGAQ